MPTVNDIVHVYEAVFDGTHTGGGPRYINVPGVKSGDIIIALYNTDDNSNVLSQFEPVIVTDDTIVCVGGSLSASMDFKAIVLRY